MRGIQRIRAGVFGLLLALAWVAALAAPATSAAHADLEKAVPADHTTVEQAPRTVHLEFSGPVTLAPDARHALFASHRSAEPGHALALAHLGLEPYLDLGLRLGEGTGAALFIHLARAAALVWSEMATFKSAGISQSEGASAAPSEASHGNSGAPAKPALEERQ